MRPSFLSLVAMIAAAPVGLAQDSVYRRTNAVAGRTTQLSVHFNLNKDCLPGTLPEVRVIDPPRNGSLAIRVGRVNAEHFQACSSVSAPARVVLYTAQNGFKGDDQVSYEVAKSQGGTEIQNVTITVTRPPPSPAAPGAKQGGTDL